MNRKKIFTALLLFSSQNYAAEWGINGNIHQEVGYNDNVFLSKNSQGSIWYKLIPTINFVHKTDNTLVNAHASYGFQRYLSANSLNSELQSYGVKASYLTERSTWSIDANMNSGSSYNSRATYGGVTSANALMTTYSVSPSVSYKLTESDTLGLNAGYIWLTYTGGATTNATGFYNDYQSQWLNLDWQRQWTERFSNTLTLGYSRYESTPHQSSINSTAQTIGTYYITLGGKYLLSEQWTIAGAIGGRYSIFDNNSTSNFSNSQGGLGYLANANVDYKGERLSAGLSYARTISPSYSGLLQQQDNFALHSTYLISEQLSASLAANYSIISSSGSDRTFIFVQPALNWHISPDWTLIASYGYSSQNVTETQNNGYYNNGIGNNNGYSNGASNSYMLSINYNWQGLSLSR